MELELLGARGIPQNGLISVSAAGERKQVQLSTLDRPLRFRGKGEDASQIKIDVLDVLGRARLPFQSAEQKYTLNLEPLSNSTPNRPVNMEVDVVVRPCDSDNPMSPAKEDGAVRQRREADASGYLEEHGLVNFIQFLLHSLMQDKPSDPYPFLQKQVAMRMQSKVGGATPSSGFPAYSTNPLFTVPSMQEDAEVTTLLGNLSPTAATRGIADVATLEREAEEARKRLLADNEVLKKSANDLSAEYQRLMQESALLQKQLEAKRQAKAQSKAVEAYREIEKLQDEVKQLARENAALVSKLARGREMINLVRQDMQQIQQDIGQ